MDYYYTEQDLCDILETSIKEYETEFGIPDKVINSFLQES